MYRLKDGLKSEDYNLSMNNIRHELEGSIEYEQHRDNVDQAKKRAVRQFMDYEGFRQMVLGADLKTINRDELKDLAGVDKGKRFAQKVMYREDPNDDLRSPDVIQLNQGQAEEDSQAQVMKQTTLKIETPTETLAGVRKQLYEDDDQIPRTFAEFKKSCEIILGKNQTEEREDILIKWMQNYVPTSQLGTLFTLDMDVQPLIWVVDIFDRITKNVIQGKVPADTVKSDLEWFLSFFSAVTTVRTFNVGIRTMIKPTERSELKKVLERIVVILGEGSEFNKLVDVVRKGFLK